jgi:hypothetical protein
MIVKSEAGLARNGPDPKQNAGRHHGPHNEIGRLSDSDRARFAIAEEPQQKTAQGHSPRSSALPVETHFDSLARLPIFLAAFFTAEADRPTLFVS